MKKRLLSLLLCLVLVVMLLPVAVSAETNDSNGIINPAAVQDKASGKLNLSKELTDNGDGTYNITMESYATGEVNSFTEKVPTDFVVVVDQSGSMSETDMPSDYTTASSKYLEDIATSSSGYYYYDSETGNYYRVYAVKGYLYEYFAENTKWVRDIVQESNAGLTWFQRQGDAGFDVANQYYYKTTDGVYRPVTVSIAGEVARYELRFRYTDANGKTVYFHYPDKPYYKPWVTVGHAVQDPYTDGQPLYGTANWAVKRVFSSDDTAYTYATVLGWLTTGMYINYPMYKRHVGYTELRYRDINGVEHTVPASNGSSTWEYCNSSSQAITTYDGSTRPTYSGLYTESGTNKSRLSALKEALTQFAGAVANETDSFGAVDNKVSILGFSSSGHNNTELLTGDNVTISNNNGVQKSTADNNASKYYGTALVNSTNGTAGTVNSQITSAINAITANGGTQPEDGLNMAYKVLANRSTTKYTVRSGADKGNQVDRNTIVIFFTDGHPGNYAYVDMYSEANDVVEAAKQIKDYGTSLFSIGVFGESDGNPLTYPAHKVTSADSDYEYDLGWMRTITPSEDDGDGWYYYYLNRNWLPNDSANYGSTANDTIYDYMSVVSSNYPDATEFMNVNSTGLADTTGYSSYLAMCNAVRSTSTAETSNKYYRMASNQDTLVAAFLQAVTMNNEETETSSLDSTAIFKDAVNTENFDISNAIYTIKWQPVTMSNGSVVNYGTATTKVNPTVVPTSGEITYSGFDYSGNCVTESKDGQKLIITISGLVPKKMGTALESNDGNAGIYGEDDEDPTVSIASPTLDTTLKYFAVQGIKVKASDRSLSADDDQTIYLASQYTSKKFDITKAIPAGYLYGGTFDGFTYDDETETGTLGKAHEFDSNENGLAFTPTAGTTYYRKEVPNSYLKTKNLLRRNSAGELKKCYLLSSVDNPDDYSQVGYVINDDRQPSDEAYEYVLTSRGTLDNANATIYVSNDNNWLEKNDDGKYAFTVSIKNDTKELALTDSDVTQVFANPSTSGYLALYKVSLEGTHKGQAYWITKDGVLVTGDNIRTITNGKKETIANEESGQSKTSVPTGTVTGAKTLKATMYVGADETEDEEIIIPEQNDVTLKGYTASLNGNIALNYYFTLSDKVLQDPDACMKFTFAGGNHTADTVYLKDVSTEEIEGQTCYVFSAGMAAKNMGDGIHAQFVLGDGTVAAEYDYSVRDYCETIIKNEKGLYTDKEIAVATAMLNYAGYAQEYFNYNKEDLANANIDKTLPEVDLDESYDVVKEGECTDIAYRGSRVMMTTTTDIRHYFNFTGDPEDYTFEANGETLEVQEDSTGKYVAIMNIPAKNMRDMVTLTVTNNNDGSTYKLTYGVYTNIKRVVTNNTGKYDDTAKNVMRAMYQYGKAAYDYFRS